MRVTTVSFCSISSFLVCVGFAILVRSKYWKTSFSARTCVFRLADYSITTSILISPKTPHGTLPHFTRTEGRKRGKKKMWKKIYRTAFLTFHYFKCFKVQREAISAGKKFDFEVQCTAAAWRAKKGIRYWEEEQQRSVVGGKKFVFITVDYRLLQRVQEFFHVLQNTEF